MSARRVCSEPGCPTLTDGGRCDEHRRERYREADQSRGSRHQRGYDSAYFRARTAALRGAAPCATCGGRFTEGNPATGGHVQDIRAGGSTADGIVAQCRLCNYGWRRAQGTDPDSARGPVPLGNASQCPVAAGLNKGGR